MKIKPIASNMTEYYKDNGDVILYSYETPVAAILSIGPTVIKDAKKYNSTTTRHINKWFNHDNMHAPCVRLSAFNVQTLDHEAFLETIK